jgi:hypothetical protein
MGLALKLKGNKAEAKKNQTTLLFIQNRGRFLAGFPVAASERLFLSSLPSVESPENEEDGESLRAGICPMY